MRLLTPVLALWMGACGPGTMDGGDAGAGQDAGTGGRRAGDADVGDAGGGDAGVGDAGADGFDWRLPPGFPEPKVPDDNPMSEAKVQLGRHLFYDERLSANESQSCASCHQQALAFTDGRAVGLGSTGQSHTRGSMSLANVGYATTLTWANPVVRTLERQALVPLFGEDPVELGLVGMEDELLRRLGQDARYRTLFADAYPDSDGEVTLERTTQAIAAFQRSLISGGSAYDRYQAGDADALSDSALRGKELFFSERAECFHCHGGFNFSDSVTHVGKAFDEIAFHNTGLYNLDRLGAYPEPNVGLFAFSGDLRDMGRFKAPTLRNVELTAPYMHDGSIATLPEVIDHYAAGGRTIADGPNAGIGSDNPNRSEFVTGFDFDAQEKADLIAFLRALTDEDFVTNPRFSDPWQ